MMHALRIVPVLCLAATAGAHAAAGPNMKPGLWEVTVKMEMLGMPQGMPPRTSQRCITPKDTEDPSKVGPGDAGRPGKGASDCTMSNYRMQGNTASWEMTCKGPEQMKGTGSITYEGDRYSGVNRMSMNQGGKPTQMTMTYSGRRLGDCKPGAK